MKHTYKRITALMLIQTMTLSMLSTTALATDTSAISDSHINEEHSVIEELIETEEQTETIVDLTDDTVEPDSKEIETDTDMPENAADITDDTIPFIKKSTSEGLFAITIQPEDITAEVGETVYFKVAATGTGLSYQWEYSRDNGVNWVTSSYKTDTCKSDVLASKDGYLYRCIITDANGNTLTSENAKLNVNVFAITSQPEDITAEVGETVYFKVAATGTGLSYQWEYSRDNGINWVTSSYKTDTCKSDVLASKDGYLYRCIITDANGNTLTSENAKLNVNVFAITSQPEDITAEVGETVYFKVAATGTGLSYQWEYSRDNGINWVTSSYKTDTCKSDVLASKDGYLYRCIIKDANGNTLTSESAKLNVNVFAITSQPEDITAEVGETVYFKVAATGTGLSYQWEYSRDNGVNWVTSSYKTDTCKSDVLASKDGYLYRCIIKDANGNTLTSESAKLNVNVFAITSQPEDITAEVGETVYFKVAATGTGLSYQWEYSRDNGVNWVTSSYKTDTCKSDVLASKNGYLYRCIIKDANGNTLTSESAKLNVNVFAITSQPEDITAEVGETVYFKVAATGTGLSYQWEYSRDNGVNWVTSSYKTDTCKSDVLVSKDGYLYRCIIKDANGNTLTSESAKLNVNVFTITSQPEDITAEVGETVYFKVAATGTGLSYQWEYSRDNGVNWVTSSYKTDTCKSDVLASKDGYLYRCIIKDANGNTLTSESANLNVNVFTITSQPEDITAEVGETVYFKVAATGTGLSYQWEYSRDNGVNWVTSSYKTDTCKSDVLASKDGYLYRCIITDANGNTLTTESAALRVSMIKIITHPEDWTGANNTRFYFYTEAEGDNLTYQWQVSTNGGNSWIVSSVTGTIYNSTITESLDGRLYRCAITDANGVTVYSNIAKLTLSNNFKIVKQPENYIGSLGSTATLHIQAGGTDIAYQWQTSSDGIDDWADVNTTTTATTTRLGQTIRPAVLGAYYRCLLTNGDGKILVSNVVQIFSHESGFITYDERIYYIREDGTVAVGLLSTDKGKYFFSISGIMLTGYQTIDDTYYYFDTETGAAVTGWNNSSKTYYTYYFSEDSSAHTGWLKLDTGNYYFYSNGTMARGITLIDGQHFYMDITTGAQQTGLIEVGVNNYMFFSETDGTAQTGLMNINGKLYYFSDDPNAHGVAASGLQTVNDTTYYFDTITKQAVKGFVTEDDNTYYMSDDFTMLTGLQWIDNCLYYFSSSGRLSTGVRQLDEGYYCFDPESGTAISGWYTADTGITYYFDPTTFTAVSGVQKIDGVYYYFSDSCRLTTGLVSQDGIYYYFPEDESTQAGFFTVGSKTFYMDESHLLLTGVQDIDGKLYYFNTTGTMLTGLREIDGVRYYFDNITGEAVTGFVTSSTGYNYYFDGANGGLVGYQEINGELYYLSSSSIIQHGRSRDTDSGAYYIFDWQTGAAVSGWWTYTNAQGVAYMMYFDPETHQSLFGLQEIDGALYYFDEYGQMKTGSRSIDGVTYYFDKATGAAYTGTRDSEANTWQTEDDKTYYYDASSNPVTGLRNIDGALYYFDDSGAMTTGLVTVDGKGYYFTENGAKSGMQEINGETYYFSTVDFSAVTGARRIDSIFYFFDSSGRVKTGWTEVYSGNVIYLDAFGGTLTGLHEIDGNTYWFDSNGIRKSGIQTVEDATGNTYTLYFDENGINQTGLITYGGFLYYFNEKTGMQETGWITVNEQPYYFNPSSGRALSGLRLIDNCYYFFNINTYVRELGLKQINGRLYYLSDDTEDGLGHGFIEVENSLYYFNASGYAITGYYSEDGERYYFDPDTFASVGGIHWANSNRAYAFVAGGGYETGLLGHEGKTYYFYPSNGRMATGLVSVGNTLYYFDADDGMLTSTTVEIAGITYQIDENGSVTASGNSMISELINSGIAKLGIAYGSKNELNDYYVEEDDDDQSYYDCSTFISAVLGDAGIGASTSVSRQYYALMQDGYDVEFISDLSEAQPGDLIYISIVDCPYGEACTFWNEIHHAMIYLGDGKVMQATSGDGAERSGVLIQDWSESSDRFIHTIVRINNIAGND